jgi:hypothetical protein
MMEIVRANEVHLTCRGNGDGMQAEETRRNTGNPSGDRSSWINWQLVRDGPGRVGRRRGLQYLGSRVTPVEGRGLS